MSPTDTALLNILIRSGGPVETRVIQEILWPKHLFEFPWYRRGYNYPNAYLQHYIWRLRHKHGLRITSGGLTERWYRYDGRVQ